MHEHTPHGAHLREHSTLLEEAEYFTAHPDEIQEEYLNNLRLHVPESNMRKFWEQYPDILDAHYPPHEGMSPLRTQQSLREFHAVIDEEVQRIGEANLVKLYHALRERGYSHYDIVR